MSKTVIQVNNLSKRYRIGLKEKQHDTFAGQVLSTLKAPIANFRQLRSMSKFGEEDESVFWALRDINFEVKEGEVLGIIGHNGAGKSTLLKILSRITEPTSGEIHLKGRVSALLEVGTGFHPDLTGRENVYMNGTILGMTRREIDAKFDEIVDFSGVEKYIDTPVKFYSSGMKVRLAFAVAAHLEPEILIIDEVLAVGDVEFQKKCLGKMQGVAENDGRTVLFVSHDMNAVQGLCQNGIVLKNGNVGLYGITNEAINFYLENLTPSSQRISNRDDRRGQGILKFSEVWVNNIPSGEGEIIMDTGENLVVNFCLEKSKVISLKAIDIAFSVHHAKKGIVSTFSSYIENFLIIDSNKIECTCIVPSLPLLPGLYSINIFCGANNERQDTMHNVFKLHILSNRREDENIKFYDSSKHGVIRFENIWNRL